MQLGKRKDKKTMLFLTFIVVTFVFGYWISISKNALGRDAQVVFDKRKVACDKTDGMVGMSIFDVNATQWDEPKNVHEKWEVPKTTYVSSLDKSKSKEWEILRNCDFQNGISADDEACDAINRTRREGNHVNDVCLRPEERNELNELTFIDENRNVFFVILYLLVLALIRKTIKSRRNRRESRIALDLMR